MVTPSGLTASSFFLTFSRKTYVTLAVPSCHSFREKLRLMQSNLTTGLSVDLRKEFRVQAQARSLIRRAYCIRQRSTRQRSRVRAPSSPPYIPNNLRSVWPS
jgi:hypothetical protein